MTAQKSHDQLLDEALERIKDRWPNIDEAKERATMQDWDDFRLATAYLPDDTPESVYDAAAKSYGMPPLDAEDLKSLV